MRDHLEVFNSIFIYISFIFILSVAYYFWMHTDIEYFSFNDDYCKKDLKRFYSFKNKMFRLLNAITFFFLVPIFTFNKPFGTHKQVFDWIMSWVDLFYAIFFTILLAWEWIWLLFFTSFFAVVFTVLYFFICVPTFTFVFCLSAIFYYCVQLYNRVIYFNTRLKVKLSICFFFLNFSFFSFFYPNFFIFDYPFMYSKVFYVLISIWGVWVKMQTIL